MSTPTRSPTARPRRLAVVALAGLLAAAAGGATEFELGVVAGGQQTGDIGTFEGTVDLPGGPLYGVIFGWRVRPDGIVELTWTRQDSAASLELEEGVERFDVVIDTLEIGGLWEPRPEPLRPFLGLTLGTTRIAGPEQELGEGWYLSGSISGGWRYTLSEHLLLRLEGRVTGILLSDGGALACSFPPGGCSVGIDGGLLGALSARIALSARF